VIAVVAPGGRERAKNPLWAAGKLADYALSLGLRFPAPRAAGSAAAPTAKAGGQRCRAATGRRSGHDGCRAGSGQRDGGGRLAGD
jgi:hypothetical protein